MPFKVLLVEDETGFSQPLSELLATVGYEVQTVNSINAFRTLANLQTTDLLILDRSMPDGDALSLLPEVREVSNLPVIVLTGLGTIKDRILGLEADVDHYLVKPVDIEEVLALVQRHERKAKMLAAHMNAWVLNTSTWLLTSPCGLEIELTHREALLLASFVNKAGKPFHRDTLVAAMGFVPDVYDFRRLESMLSRLRKKISESGIPIFPLENIYGGKYAFNAFLTLKDAVLKA